MLEIFAVVLAILFVRIADMVAMLIGGFYLDAKRKRFERWCDRHEVVYEEE